MKFNSKHLFLCLFLSITTITIFGQNKIGEIKIDENEKNITNLSGALNDSISFHLIVNKIKGKRSFQTSAVFFEASGKSKTMVIETSDKKPVYLTFHSSGTVLTLTKLLEESVLVQSVDYNDESIHSETLNGIPVNIFPLTDMTILNFSRSLDLAFIKSSKDIQRNKARFRPGADKKSFVNPSFKEVDFIGDTQFLPTGSTKQVKVFYHNDQFILVNDLTEKGIVNLIFVTSDGLLNSKSIEVSKKGKVKKFRSFVKDNLLFSFCIQKKAAYLNIYNLKDFRKTKEYKYDLTDFGSFNKILFNGEEQTKETLKSKRFLRGFYTNSVGGSYVPELYLGINKTVENEYVIKIGHTDKEAYTNSNMRNFWWGSRVFSAQLNTSSGDIQVSVSSVATLQMTQMLISNFLGDVKRRGNYFELYVDKDLNPIEKPSEFINKEKLTQSQFTEIYKYRLPLKLKRYFFIPFDDKVRLINFDKDIYGIYELKR